MESKINYTLVGIFVFLLLAGLISFVIWLQKLTSQDEFDYYYVYMNESVAGLNPDASVKYKGVNIGTVDHIGINPNNPEQVELLLKIQHGIKITQETRATLKSFGITGLTFIELSGTTSKGLPLKTNDNDIPVIPATPSIFSQLDGAFNTFTEKSTLALDKFNELMNDENIQNLNSVLVESKLLLQDIRKEIAGFKQLIDHGIIMEQEATEAFRKVNEASESIHKMAVMVNNNYADIGSNVEEEIRQSLAAFNKLMFELDILANELQRTVQKFENSPGDLLFKKSRIKPGPGEAGYAE